MDFKKYEGINNENEHFQLGVWNSTTGLNVTMDPGKAVQQSMETLENKTLRVTVILVSCKNIHIALE